MLKKKKPTYTELTIAYEELKIENATYKYKLDALEEKNKLLSTQVEELKHTEAAQLGSENKSLKDKIRDLEFSIANDVQHINLKTHNETLKSEIEIIKSENKYLKELLDTYRALPDVKSMIDNLSGLAIPSIDKLKEFCKVISEDKVGELCELLNGNIQAIKNRDSYYGRCW